MLCGTGLLESPGLSLLGTSEPLMMAGLPRSNGINVLQVTEKCQGSPGTAYGFKVLCPGGPGRAALHW